MDGKTDLNARLASALHHAGCSQDSVSANVIERSSSGATKRTAVITFHDSGHTATGDLDLVLHVIENIQGASLLDALRATDGIVVKPLARPPQGQK